MTWMVQSPWPIAVLGLTAEVILAVLLIRTRRGNIVGAMVAVATATLGLVVIERLVVTDREEIEEMLDGTSHALAANDAQGVLAMFTTDSPQVNEVREKLGHVTIRQATISDLEVHVDKSVTATATAQFTERVVVRDNLGTAPFEPTKLKVKVTLHRERGRWLLYEYTATEVEKNASAPPH